ncbi:hypothetical protein [Microvirga alba]|uniref:Uncharacterized protein n=1 Tax=Microvirga alba TaxID=2791025 RepID=A0A931FPU0_9HYPH|nr:hypothetical protein [Microvirga alba]MBF9235130.1 hypothetical protein [Microvirga alba]
MGKGKDSTSTERGRRFREGQKARIAALADQAELLTIKVATLTSQNVSLRAHRDALLAELDKQDVEIAELKESVEIAYQLYQKQTQALEEALHGTGVITPEIERKWEKMYGPKKKGKHKARR